MKGITSRGKIVNLSASKFEDKIKLIDQFSELRYLFRKKKKKKEEKIEVS